MGAICGNKKQTEYDQFNNYHCKKCGEIPLLYFSNFDFNIICLKHKILNIPIEEFYNFIILDYQCWVCRKLSSNKNVLYCNECDKIFCNNCINKHKQNKNESHLITNNIIEKNTMCKLHNKKYSKFCIQCKLNLCELCENSYNHYTEIFTDIYPLDEEIKGFKDLAIKILKDNLEEQDIISCYEGNDDELINNNQENECIKLKLLFIESFSTNISNYNYINNINNIIRCTFLKDLNIKNVKNDIKYINYKESKYDIDNIENKILIKSISKYNTGDFNSQTLCMKKLNDICISGHKILELVAIGGSNHKILLLNILNFYIYQIINEHKSAVYSLDQYKEDSQYLFSSSGDSTLNIYKLNNDYKYELIQKIKKSQEKNGGEINKVIVLSNKLLVTGDHRTITIWKTKALNEDKIHYENFHEIILNRDTYQLLEVNPSIFVATQFSHGGHFQIYKNDGELFPLIGELVSIKSHGSGSNGLSKINDKLVCSATENNLLYIICIDPLQIIQKIKMEWEKCTTIFYTYVTSDNYLYFKGEYQSIVQFKIITDEDNNFIELVEIGKYNDKIYSNSYEKAILPFDDGRIFFVEEKVGQICYNLIA